MNNMLFKLAVLLIVRLYIFQTINELWYGTSIWYFLKSTHKMNTIKSVEFCNRCRILLNCHKMLAKRGDHLSQLLWIPHELKNVNLLYMCVFCQTACQAPCCCSSVHRYISVILERHKKAVLGKFIFLLFYLNNIWSN